MVAIPSPGHWVPILTDAAGADRVNRALDELAAALAEVPPVPADPSAEAAAAPAPPAAPAATSGSAETAGPGADPFGAAAAAPAAANGSSASVALADGSAGRALFFHYLDQARPGEGHDERALAHLEAAIAATASTMSVPGLYSGFSGVAWVLEHLTGRLLEAPGPGEEDPGREVADALADYLRRTPWLDDYDLISGLVGYGVWAVERAPRPLAEEAAGEIARRLGELAEECDGGLTWRTPHERMLPSEAANFPEGNFNCGVAHGVPGVIGILAELVAAGLAAGEARELLAGAVAWLLRQPLPDGGPSRFPYHVAPGGPGLPSRLAWCYGDPGVAVTLLGAARAAGDPEWERQAVATARLAAARPRADAGVVDGSLCHGAAGLAHLYNRLYQATREEVFRTEAVAWFERLMELRRPGEGVAGWCSWRPIGDITLPNPELGWVPDPGFLTGAAGIGLALLGGISAVEPSWDRVLLSAVPPRPLAP